MFSTRWEKTYSSPGKYFVFPGAEGRGYQLVVYPYRLYDYLTSGSSAVVIRTGLPE